MPRIAIVNDLPEVVTIVAALLTKGERQFLTQIGATEYTIQRLKAFDPLVLVLPLVRKVDSLDRPLRRFDADIEGGKLLELIAQEADLRRRPCVLLGFSVRQTDVPEPLKAAFADLHFLEFPLGLQEINPLLSAYLGPAR